MAYIYRHIRLDKNQVFYIGIGKDDEGIYKRAKTKNRKNIYWQNVTKKTSYEIEIILDDLTWEEAKVKEKEFIKLYGRKDLRLGTLCNFTDGGEGVLNPSEETRKIMSLTHKGKIISKAQRDIIGKANLGRIKSLEERKKISDAHLGKVFTSEHRANISKARLGKKLSLTNKKMLLDYAKKLVLNLETGIYYESITEARNSTNCCASIFSNKLNNTYRKNDTSFILV